MNAATVSMPVALTVLHLSIAEMPAPATKVGYVEASYDVSFAAAADVGAQAWHVQSWRASLGHAYAEWTDRVPGAR